MGAATAIDRLGARGYRNLAANLTAPLGAGSILTPIPIAPDGSCEVGWPTRVPLLLVAPRSALDAARLAVTATLDGGAGPPARLEFAPWTEAGSALPMHAPEVGEDGHAAPARFAIAATRLAAGIETPVTPADLAGLLEVTLVEGQLGRLTYLLTAEKNRLRRVAAEIAMTRRLGSAHRDALDRYGADLGVPRRTDAIVWDEASGEIVSRQLTGSDGAPVAEDDRDYRRRLSLYRPFALPTRRRLETLLNGSPETGASGPIAELGSAAHFRIRENENRFAVAVHLFAGGSDQPRLNFLDHIGQARLIWPRSDPPANSIHAARVIPETSRTEIQALRAALRAAFDWPAGAAVAPALATALARGGRIVRALGSTLTWTVLRAQDAAGGSRYELGLGVDVGPASPADSAALHAAMMDPGRAPSGDEEAEAILASLRAAAPPGDDDAAWLWQAAGLQTVHRIDGARLYLSHLPTRGLLISGLSTAPVGQTTPLEAHFHAAGDAGINAALFKALERADSEWQAGGHAPLDRVDDAAAPALWDQAVALPAGSPAAIVLAAAGLPVVTAPDIAVARLKTLAGELTQTIRLPADLAAKILANHNDAAPSLAALSDVVSRAGVASALPLVLAAGDILLVLGAVGLPEAGINLNDRRLTGFRWYAVPLGGSGRVQPLGNLVDLTVEADGLFAIVALGYERTDQCDPYEVQLDLPEGEVINLAQYELLMNLLESRYPVGVEINTFSIRRRHVDVDGDGAAEPLRGSAGSTYRRYRDPRAVGRYRASNPIV